MAKEKKRGTRRRKPTKEEEQGEKKRKTHYMSLHQKVKTADSDRKNLKIFFSNFCRLWLLM